MKKIEELFLIKFIKFNVHRNKQYKIKDNFISFWFQFIYPNRALLEMDKTDIVLKKIKSNH